MFILIDQKKFTKAVDTIPIVYFGKRNETNTLNYIKICSEEEKVEFILERYLPPKGHLFEMFKGKTSGIV